MRQCLYLGTSAEAATGALFSITSIVIFLAKDDGQNVPMILVEKASLVSGFPYTTEDPVYTPPTENSTAPGNRTRLSSITPIRPVMR